MRDGFPEYMMRQEDRFVGESGHNPKKMHETLASVAAQLMTGRNVLVEEQTVPVKRVGAARLRMVEFTLSGRPFEAIEQNPESPAGGESWRGRSIRWCSFGMLKRINMWECQSMGRCWSTERKKHKPAAAGKNYRRRLGEL